MTEKGVDELHIAIYGKDMVRNCEYANWQDLIQKW